MKRTLGYVAITTLSVLSLSQVHSEEQRVHAKVGSYWHYDMNDEILNKKSVTEFTITEIKDGLRTLRMVTRGLNGFGLFIYNDNWDIIEGSGWKTDPSIGNGPPETLEVGATRTTEAMSARQEKTKWADPRPYTATSTITDMEMVSTKAGKFMTYKYVVTTKFKPSAELLAENTTTTTYWFSPKIDHYVKSEYEQRTDGHLGIKNASELIEYKLK